MAEAPSRRSVILLSGGLDSAANLALCRLQDEPVLALTADYGQRAAPRELRAAKAISEYYDVKHEVVDLRWLGQLGGSSLTDSSRAIPEIQTSELDQAQRTTETARAVWVPNRNGVLINVAAAFAETYGATNIVVGFNREEAATFPDNSQAFLERSSEALRYSTSNSVQVECYTVNNDKTEIVARLKDLKDPFPFHLVWSCYHSGVQPCGRCESCRRFMRAIENGGVRSHE
jgi:7-cyano-7-deazaguanine synthase